jgi:signal transduction histidine kinase/ligand-binding sensor domain-containing protein
MRLHFIHTVLFLLLILNSSHSQQFNVKTYSFAQGLSTYNIKKALQDKYGFIWLATQDGVYRFDGTSFDPYKKTSDITNSLRENFIFDIALGNDENLYIASFNGGVDVINIRTQKITHLLSQKAGHEEGLPNLWINKIYCDVQNNLWIGAQDFLKIYSLKEKKYKNFQLPGNFESDINVLFIRPVNKNIIAVGIDNYGVLFYDINSLMIQDSIIKLEDTQAGNITVSDLAILNDSCYISSGSNVFNGAIVNNRWVIGRKITIPAVSNNVINCLAAGKNNELWVGTNGGFGKLDVSKNLFNPIVNNEFFSADNFIFDIFPDREDGLWISSLTNLIRMNLVASPFTAYKKSADGKTRMNHIYSLVPADKTHLFACGADGLYLADLITGDIKKITGTAALGIIHRVIKMDEDLWLLSSSAGMYAYRPTKGIISRDLLLKLYPEWKPFTKNFFNNTVTSGDKIYWANEGQGGLLIWQPQKHIIKQKKAGSDLSGGLPENHIHNIKFDKDGFIWIMFDNAVAKFDPAIDSTVQIINYKRNSSGFNSGIFFDMYDNDSVLWFGTYGGGINGYNKKTGNWTYITELDGLCNNAVYGILPEKDSIFWVSTNNGLSRVNYVTKKCLNYFAEDGLQDNSFDETGALAIGDKLFFSGINGFTSVDLDNYSGNSYPFPVYIKRIEYIRKNKKTILNNLEWNKIELPAGTTSATIWLSAISYTSNRPGFSYKIKGFQNEYLPAGDKNKIELNALSYGDYEIDIRYINEKGEFVENAIGVNMVILPYWYQTWWFRILVTVLALSAILFVVRLIYISRMRKQRAMLEKQLAVQMERQRISSEMHDDIGAGLSGIKLLTEMTKGKVHDEVVEAEMEKIYQSVGDISGKMKEVIWSLNTENDQLSSLISYIHRQVRQWLENYPCELYITIPEKIPDIEINGESRRNIFLAVKEAVHNIIKHSGANKVNIEITCNGILKILVSDNGRGIHKGEANDTGNGLRNMQQRMHNLHGKFLMQNKEGLTLIFEIPFK